MSAPWAAHGGLISHYDSLVCSGSLQEDDQQRAALLQLEQLNRVMTDYTNIPILLPQPKDCLHSQPTSELKNNTSKVNLAVLKKRCQMKKKTEMLTTHKRYGFICAKRSSAICECLQWRKKLSSPNFSQTPALALCHCLICCGTVVCRSKQLQPVCVCGGGEWEEDQTKHLLDHSTAPYWVRKPHLSLASVMRGRHCLGKRFPAPLSIWGNKHKTCTAMCSCVGYLGQKGKTIN